MIPEPIAVKATFVKSLRDCKALFKHCLDPVGVHTLSGIEASFLQLQRSWESFLEESMLIFLCGKQPLNANRYTPKFTLNDIEIARSILYHNTTKGFVEWTATDIIKGRYRIFFLIPDDTHPLIASISAISEDLSDIKKIRNVIAHSSVSCKTTFNSLCEQRTGKQLHGITRAGEFLIYKKGKTNYFSHYAKQLQDTAISIIG